VHYVYLLQSLSHPNQRYVGCTRDLRARLKKHNARASSHTSKHVPWRLVTYIAFTDEARAASFERYLKSGSGHAFANRHLW
jgi:predicted GIY-YIG superfamily endonuclease